MDSTTLASLICDTLNMDSFFRAASDIFRSQQGTHTVLNGCGVTVLIMAERKPSSKPYSELSLRSRQQAHQMLSAELPTIGMSLSQVYRWALSQNEVKSVFDVELRNPGSILQKLLIRNSIGMPLAMDLISSLYSFMNITERQVQFIRSYISNGPTVTYEN